ncbi:hypothetical protein PR048_023073 [Dryococelus australis]|uniref:Uncharacterized protein n=1 Tax=Dryococelus australis TaxID=614101 RepID=A0ABQ9GT47_9NEOP|nr:hypothetical protein PR048_023073 [Dryococelus australis]
MRSKWNTQPRDYLGDRDNDTRGKLQYVPPTDSSHENRRRGLRSRGHWSDTGDTNTRAWRHIVPTRKTCSVLVVALYYGSRSVLNRRPPWIRVYNYQHRIIANTEVEERLILRTASAHANKMASLANNITTAPFANRRLNERAGETGDPRENPPTSSIVRHDSHLRKSGVTRPGIEPGSTSWEASRLTAQPPWPLHNTAVVQWSDYSTPVGSLEISHVVNEVGVGVSITAISLEMTPETCETVPRQLKCTSDTRDSNSEKLVKLRYLAIKYIAEVAFGASTSDGWGGGGGGGEAFYVTRDRIKNPAGEKKAQLLPPRGVASRAGKSSSNCRARISSSRRISRPDASGRPCPRSPEERASPLDHDRGRTVIDYRILSCSTARPESDMRIHTRDRPNRLRKKIHLEDEAFCCSQNIVYRLFTWLDYSPPTKAIRARFPAGSPPGFSHVGIVPDDTAGRRVFSRISGFRRPSHSGAAPHSPRFTLIGSQDHVVKSRTNIFTHRPLRSEVYCVHTGTAFSTRNWYWQTGGSLEVTVANVTEVIPVVFYPSRNRQNTFYPQASPTAPPRALSTPFNTYSRCPKLTQPHSAFIVKILSSLRWLEYQAGSKWASDIYRLFTAGRKERTKKGFQNCSMNHEHMHSNVGRCPDYLTEIFDTGCPGGPSADRKTSQASVRFPARTRPAGMEKPGSLRAPPHKIIRKPPRDNFPGERASPLIFPGPGSTEVSACESSLVQWDSVAGPAKTCFPSPLSSFANPTIRVHSTADVLRKQTRLPVAPQTPQPTLAKMNSFLSYLRD